MFADGIRLIGLEVLARHRIAEGLPLCVSLIEPDRWGLDARIRRCLAALRLYGGAARSEVPRLRQLGKALVGVRWKAEKISALAIPDLIQAIEGDDDPPALRPLERVH